MGFRVLLIAVTGKSPDAVHNDYGVTPTGRYEEIPESPVTGATLPSGAYLLYINDQIEPDDHVFARLSKDASLIACYANETVMNSVAGSWVDGVEQWSVSHDAQQGIEHLESTGPVPHQLEPIRKSAFAKQDDDAGADHIFDIPIELFAALGGIRYDQDIEGAGPEPWEILTRR
ncbi:MAG: hypothetical protein L0Y71_25840 [Gemmataceae bacterium]|nr:hypothetical protein [Gemmataceae bacterium]